MSDRALRTRSRSRGRSGRSSPDMYASWYAEESYEDGYRAGFQQGCFTDGETRGYLDGLNSRRMNKAQQGDESDNDSTDDERRNYGQNLGFSRRRIRATKTSD